MRELRRGERGSVSRNDVDLRDVSTRESMSLRWHSRLYDKEGNLNRRALFSIHKERLAVAGEFDEWLLTQTAAAQVEILEASMEIYLNRNNIAGNPDLREKLGDFFSGVLLQALSTESNVEVASKVGASAVFCIGELQGLRSQEEVSLISALEHEDRLVRTQACIAFGKKGKASSKVIEKLRCCLRAPEEVVSIQAQHTLEMNAPYQSSEQDKVYAMKRRGNKPVPQPEKKKISTKPKSSTINPRHGKHRVGRPQGIIF